MAAPSPIVYRTAGVLLLVSLVLIVLKAAGRIDISWLMATAPVWALWVLCVVVVLLVGSISLLIQTVRRK